MSLTDTIIADPPPASSAGSSTETDRRFARTLAAIAIGWGTIAAIVYYAQGLTLSHYDAKAHLVVARRIIDNLTPGWEQIGAVWLPLPHLLNFIPVQIDLFYRTGATAVAISIASFGLAVYAMTRLIVEATGSRTGAVAAALLLALNPNVLYLQSTAMTEPLLIGLLLLSAWMMLRWTADPPKWRRAAGWSLVAAGMTRYEAWPFTGAVLVLAAGARWWKGDPFRSVITDTARLAVYPIVSYLWFMAHSRVTVGAWFVTGGFYVPDPAMQGHPLTVTKAVAYGASQLGSYVLLGAAVGAVFLIVRTALSQRQPKPALLVPLALTAVAALPWHAFHQGHPLRIRYMVPTVVAAIVCSGIGIGLLKRNRQRLAAVVLVLAVLATVRPFDPRARMVVEAQWDTQRSRERRWITACMAEREPNDVVLMSMGALAHYMQELSHAGYHIRDFLFEGNTWLWEAALASPADHVNWMVIEEIQKGGDRLSRRAASDPAFLRGFVRACEGGGVALYKKIKPQSPTPNPQE
jgi:hypothetical protein